MKRLFFVRHGETDANVAELLSGQIETSLTEKGIQQAKQTGQDVKQTLPPIDLIICSTLSRAYHTAQIIAGEIGYPVGQIRQNALFVERSFGTLEGTKSTKFITGNNYYKLDAVEGSETVEDLQKRAAEAFEFASQLEADNILIVGHGAFERALRRVANNQPHTDEYLVYKQIPNAAIVELV